MKSIQQNTQIVKSQLIRKLRPSLYQMPQGQLVGFGPVEAKRGNGWSFCFNCNLRYCEHVHAVSEAWLGGQSIQEEFITFNGYHADPVPAPPIGSTVVTQADIDAVNEGNRPGAWRATSREELPQGWPMSGLLR